MQMTLFMEHFYVAGYDVSAIELVVVWIFEAY